MNYYLPNTKGDIVKRYQQAITGQGPVTMTKKRGKTKKNGKRAKKTKRNTRRRCGHQTRRDPTAVALKALGGHQTGRGLGILASLLIPAIGGLVNRLQGGRGVRAQRQRRGRQQA